MFTSSVLNNSFRMADTSLTGGLHLNALNGSSNVLGYNNPSSSDGPSSSPSDNAYGGLFGVSLSENHPYRPVDSGRSFHESCSNSKLSSSSSPTREESGFYKRRQHNTSRDDPDTTVAAVACATTTTAATINPSSTKNNKKSSRRFFSPSPLSRRRQYLYHTDSNDSLSPLGMRRFSLNIDTDRISTHAQCGSDLSLSLEDISTPRCGPAFPEEVCYDAAAHNYSSYRATMAKGSKNNSREGSKEEGLDMARLSITQVDIDASETGLGASRHGGHHSGRRTRRLTTDVNGVNDNSRGSKMLEKIKDSKKSDHSKSKHKSSSSSRDKSPRPPSASRHHVTHAAQLGHLTSSATSTAKKDQRKKLSKSAFSRHSVD